MPMTRAMRSMAIMTRATTIPMTILAGVRRRRDSGTNGRGFGFRSISSA